MGQLGVAEEGRVGGAGLGPRALGLRQPQLDAAPAEEREPVLRDPVERGVDTIWMEALACRASSTVPAPPTEPSCTRGEGQAQQAAQLASPPSASRRRPRSRLLGVAAFPQVERGCQQRLPVGEAPVELLRWLRAPSRAARPSTAVSPHERGRRGGGLGPIGPGWVSVRASQVGMSIRYRMGLSSIRRRMEEDEMDPLSNRSGQQRTPSTTGFAPTGPRRPGRRHRVRRPPRSLCTSDWRFVDGSDAYAVRLPSGYAAL